MGGPQSTNANENKHCADRIQGRVVARRRTGVRYVNVCKKSYQLQHRQDLRLLVPVERRASTRNQLPFWQYAEPLRSSTMASRDRGVLPPRCLLSVSARFFWGGQRSASGSAAMAADLCSQRLSAGPLQSALTGMSMAVSSRLAGRGRHRLVRRLLLRQAPHRRPAFSLAPWGGSRRRREPARAGRASKGGCWR